MRAQGSRPVLKCTSHRFHHKPLPRAFVKSSMLRRNLHQIPHEISTQFRRLVRRVMSATKTATLRATFNVADVALGPQDSAATTIYGMPWCIRVKKWADTGVLVACLHTDGPTFADNRSTQWRAHAKFTVTVMPAEKKGPAEDTFDKAASRGYHMLPWATLIDPANGHVVDGVFNVEIAVEVNKPEFSVDGRVWVDGKIHAPIRLGDALDDMAVSVGGEQIRCHKTVVCNQSKVISAAMTNEATDEHKANVFPIGHAAATRVNVEAFMGAMYDGWRADTMDAHAAELLHLAHCYEAVAVENMAVDALQRLLTAETFWRTLSVGVALRTASVGQHVIDMCAVYADDPPTKLSELANRDDGRALLAEDTNNCAAALLLAIAKKNAAN